MKEPKHSAGDTLPEGPVKVREEPPLEGLQRIVFFSLLAGTAALIPLPLLDEWAYRWVRRRLVADVFQRKGAVADWIAVRTLAGERDAFQGGACLYQVFFVVVLLPLKILSALLRGIFRKILIFLAVKQSADWASRAFHEGYLLRHALDSMEHRPVVSEARARSLRQRITRSLEGLNTSPVWGVFAGVIRMHRNIFRRASSLLARLARRGDPDGVRSVPPAEEAEELRRERDLLDELVGRTLDALAGQKRYLQSLEERYDRLES